MPRFIPKVIQKMSRRQKLFILAILAVIFLVMLQNSPLTNQYRVYGL